MEVSHSNNLNPNSSSSPASSVRVLVRSQSSSSTSNAHHCPSSSSPYLPSNGVVVVGFIGRRPTITNHLVNRIVDANVFGSGHSDTSLVTDNEELRGWFERRRISYYYDEEKGMVFLQFSSSSCFGFGSAVEEEELEFGDLQGMLVMFSVCHVIIYIQDGIRFDTQLLKKFRVLQAAKNGLAPFVRSQIATGLPWPPSSNTSSPAKNRSILSRAGTSVSLMSGLSSHASLFPGHCTPVMMFVFVEDFSDTPNPVPNVGDSQSSLDGLSRPSLPSKASGPVVVLARPVSKSEGGFKKTLHTSLESQIRFLIKKCRTVSSSAPLFSLDSSRAVVLLDRSANQIAEPLEFATRLVEDVLNGKATSDSLLLESHGQYAVEEDMVDVKDFIYRQLDILRGKGSLVGNSSSGVGMVALAAAAAAASASIRSGKAFATPELPSLEAWLSSTRLILNGILSAKGTSLDEIGINKRKPQPRSNIPQPPEPVASKVSEPLDIAASWLGSGKGLNTRFSTMWCERNLPAARAVYLKDLPPCYPSSTHEASFQKALRAFHSMVKGPAVQEYAKKLEDECTAVWKSGRQLCGAVSLTGKPCVHRIHDLPSSNAVSGSEAKPHCSGYVFLHACACGRSRRLRLDPFDFESASDYSEDCDKLLPAAQLPNLADSWSLIRVGGAKYYEPSKGLLQSGFCVAHKFLLKWESVVENKKGENGPTLGSVIHSSAEPKFEPGASTETPSVVENKRKPSETVMVLDEKKISFGKGLPNVTMRKPFAEVVAGSAARNSEFPPLQPKKQPPSTLNTSSVRQTKTDNHHKGSQKPEEIPIAPGSSNGTNTDNRSSSNGELYPRLGSYIVPAHYNPGRRNLSFTNVAVYVGFEHECPRGHRFILNPDHLKDLGKFYQSPEESHVLSSGDGSDHRPANPPKLNGNGRRRKPFKKERNTADKSKEQGGAGLDEGSSKLQVNDLGSLDRIRVDDNKKAISMLNRNLPLYMNCPHCRNSKNNQEPPKAKFAGTVSQLQRIFLVTPPFPTVLTTCPVVQFEASCLPQAMSPRHEQNLLFSLGREVVLPPESFLALRLPFVYGVKSEDGTRYSLKPFEHQPEATAWIVSGTALKIVSKGNDADQ